MGTVGTASLAGQTLTWGESLVKFPSVFGVAYSCSSRVLNEVGVNMIGMCSEKAGFR